MYKDSTSMSSLLQSLGQPARLDQGEDKNPPIDARDVGRPQLSVNGFEKAKVKADQDRIQTAVTSDDNYSQSSVIKDKNVETTRDDDQILQSNAAVVHDSYTTILLKSVSNFLTWLSRYFDLAIAILASILIVYIGIQVGTPKQSTKLVSGIEFPSRLQEVQRIAAKNAEVPHVLNIGGQCARRTIVQFVMENPDIAIDAREQNLNPS